MKGDDVVLGCQTCGKDATKRCSQCHQVVYCGRECQKLDWRQHKKRCGVVPPRTPPELVIGFEVPFGPLDDEEADCGEDYDRATHAIWEYDMGDNTWQRYPPRIEEALESISRYEYLDFMGELAPKFMYRPGNPDCDGFSERYGLSVTPPPNVATRWVIFEDMFEREIYTGEIRAVRRNGVRKRPGPTNDKTGTRWDIPQLR